MTYVLNQIRKYALKEIKSWEMLETLVMVLLVGIMIWIFCNYSVGLYSCIIFVIFTGIMIFGLSQTVPSIIMYFSPYHSRAFRMKATEEEKRRMCEEVEQDIRNKKVCEYPDILMARNYALFTGKQNIELISFSDIKEVSKKEFPFRQKYKGIFYLYFVDKKGKKHELDIHNGKEYNPVRQVSKIFHYLQENHPEIELKLSELDQDRIKEMIADDAKRELYHMK